MSSNERIVMNSRRQALMLAGALTATVFTAAAAFAGVAHRPAAPPPAAAPVVQVAPAHSATALQHEADD
jgi:hypothetical protein